MRGEKVERRGGEERDRSGGKERRH